MAEIIEEVGFTNLSSQRDLGCITTPVRASNGGWTCMRSRKVPDAQIPRELESIALNQASVPGINQPEAIINEAKQVVYNTLTPPSPLSPSASSPSTPDSGSSILSDLQSGSGAGLLLTGFLFLMLMGRKI